MKKDKDLIELVRKLSNTKNRVKVIVASERKSISPKMTDYVIIDECDEVYFSNLTWFERCMKAATIIGFTASPPSH